SARRCPRHLTRGMGPAGDGIRGEAVPAAGFSSTNPPPRTFHEPACAALPTTPPPRALPPAREPASSSQRQPAAPPHPVRASRLPLPYGAHRGAAPPVIGAPPRRPPPRAGPSPSGLLQVLGLLVGQQAVDLGPQPRVRLQLGILRQQLGRLLAGRGDDLLVPQELEQLERRTLARLRRPQHVTLTPLLQVDPGQLEPVQRRGHRV